MSAAAPNTFRHVEDYRDDPGLRAAFYALTRHVFGFTLEQWQRAQCWTEVYTCHSLMDGERMVANVSTTRMTLLVGGRPVPAVQIGTVATLPEYRGRGLARRLMESVVAKHAGLPMLLFANDSVVDFYPRFGFHELSPPEMQPVWSGDEGGPDADGNPGESAPIETVGPDDPRVRALVEAHGVHSAVFDVARGAITLFHIHQVFSAHLHYAAEMEVLIVSKRTGAVVEVFDLVAARAPEPARLLEVLRQDGVREIRYGFMPDGFGLPYRMFPYRPEDTHFFVNAAFPAVGGPFIFPLTART